jgi:hypothetical protein
MLISVLLSSILLIIFVVSNFGIFVYMLALVAYLMTLPVPRINSAG